jgi:protein ImuA
MVSDKLSTLSHVVKGLSAGHPAPVSERVSLGVPTLDDALGGGLVCGGLHEIYTATTAHIGAATGFAVAVAVRAAKGKPILWVRQDFLDTETGRLNAQGLAELGLDPARLILVRARDIEGVLRAAEQAARCSALGAVLIEPWGAPRMLDLKASRRLSLAAAQSGVPALMLRVLATPTQSAAMTRWSVQALPSTPLAANAPGFPVFELNLLRQRGGMAGRTWRVEWNREQKSFQEQRQPIVAPLSCAAVSFPPRRPVARGMQGPEICREIRRAG